MRKKIICITLRFILFTFYINLVRIRMSESQSNTLPDPDSCKKIALEIAKQFRDLLQSEEFTPQFDNDMSEIKNSEEYKAYNKKKCEQAKSNPETKTN